MVLKRAVPTVHKDPRWRISQKLFPFSPEVEQSGSRVANAGKPAPTPAGQSTSILRHPATWGFDLLLLRCLTTVSALPYFDFHRAGRILPYFYNQLLECLRVYIYLRSQHLVISSTPNHAAFRGIRNLLIESGLYSREALASIKKRTSS